MYLTDDWQGLKSQKWTTNKKHYQKEYIDQFGLPDIGSSISKTHKRMVDVPRTGKEMIEKPSIRVLTP